MKQSPNLRNSTDLAQKMLEGYLIFARLFHGQVLEPPA